jgi:hypothetical protein
VILLTNAKHLYKEIKATRANKNASGKENYVSIPEFNRNYLTTGIVMHTSKQKRVYFIPSLAVPNMLSIRKCKIFASH